MEETLCHLEYFATEGEWVWKCYFCRQNVLSGHSSEPSRSRVWALGLLHRQWWSRANPVPPWCSVPLAVTRVEAPDQLCSVTYPEPQLLTQGALGKGQVHTDAAQNVF